MAEEFASEVVKRFTGEIASRLGKTSALASTAETLNSRGLLKQTFETLMSSGLLLRRPLCSMRL